MHASAKLLSDDIRQPFTLAGPISYWNLSTRADHSRRRPSGPRRSPRAASLDGGAGNGPPSGGGGLPRCDHGPHGRDAAAPRVTTESWVREPPRQLSLAPAVARSSWLGSESQHPTTATPPARPVNS